ncbi:hypothetical protein ACWD5Q_19865 [Streptomyces sp. NPDC002513]
MDWRRCVELVTRDTTNSTSPESAEAAHRLAAGIRAAVDIRPMQDAAMSVHL